MKMVGDGMLKWVGGVVEDMLWAWLCHEELSGRRNVCRGTGVGGKELRNPKKVWLGVGGEKLREGVCCECLVWVSAAT